MATTDASTEASSRPAQTSKPNDAVLRNTLRYTISAREYAALHKYVLSRSRALRRAAPSPTAVDKALQPRDSGSGKKGSGSSNSNGTDDYNSRAVRHSLRVFAVTWFGMKGWEAISRRLRQREKSGAGSSSAPKKPFYRSNALRLSLSLSTILLLYRWLFRFLARLRAQLLIPSAEPFRQRNPRTSAALTSAYAPAVGASFAGLALGIYPTQQLRVSVAIYAMFRALEFGWNVCESEGMVWGSTKAGRKRERPWWFGSWMLQPFAFGQLFHAAIFDRDCIPKMYGDFVFGHSTAYLHSRPSDWPQHLKWPQVNQIIDSLAEMARLKWPFYISPTLFPRKEAVLPPSLTSIAPLTSRAHPLITSLSCATLHPADPSCLRTYITFWINTFPPLTRLLLLVYSALTIVPRFKALYHSPLSILHRVITTALRMSTFVTGAVSTAWASICFFQQYLPRHVLATQRFFLGGFFAGLWAWFERRQGRGFFLSSARSSIDSLWKVGVKRRWWRAMRGGDVWIFVVALMVTGVVYEKDARAVREAQWRKGISWVRGEGFRDWSMDDDDNDEVDEIKKDE